MDPDPPQTATRKLSFKPKPLKRGATKKVEPEIKDADSDADAVSKADQETLAKLNEHLTRRRQKPRAEQKPVRVSFGGGSSTNDGIRTFGNQIVGTSSRSNASDLEDMDLDEVKDVADFNGSTNPLSKKKKEYKDPWDYTSDYPTVLPLRRPFSGDPERLDKEEFENAVEYDENSINHAAGLGLLDQDSAPKMIFLQIPDKLPLGRPSSSAKGKEIVSTSSAAKGKEIAGKSTAAKGKEIVDTSAKPPVKGYPSNGMIGFPDLPEGHMGKLLVYKSGAVKWKLGDILYDVSSGADPTFPQTVVAINTSEKHCAVVGEVNKKAVVTPDIDVLLKFIDLV